MFFFYLQPIAVAHILLTTHGAITKLVLVYDFSLRISFLTLSAKALPSSYLGRSKGLCSQGRLAWTLPIGQVR